MKVAIRDDDTAFFTKPEDLEKAYDFVKKGCISLSVVPNTVPIHRDDVFPYGMGIKKGFYNIENNLELVSYLKEGFEVGKYDLLLHGYSHEYLQVNNKWIAEMRWKNQKQLEYELKEGREQLEKIFGKKITVFVAPNNSIDKKAVSVIEEMGMNYSGIILHRDRAFSMNYIYNYLLRWSVRLIKKIPYPGILDYGRHKELVAFTLDNFERLVYEYHQCKKKNQPFVVYTHYWQLNENDKAKDLLKKIYNYVLDDGAEIVSLSSCFGGAND